MKAQMCPWMTSTTNPEVCRSCNGKGWVVVYGDSNYKEWDRCPTCGGDRNSPSLTGCPMGSHYGTYSEVEDENLET